MVDRRQFLTQLGIGALGINASAHSHPCVAQDRGVFRSRRGRCLTYRVYGSLEPDARVLFYFHGLFGSGLEAQQLHDEARRQGTRIIAIDRPGMGGSDFQPCRSFRSWPAIVLEFADTLDRVGAIGSFAIAAFSGGTPYAAACAQHPDFAGRLSSVAIVSPIAPFQAVPTSSSRISTIASRHPRLFQLFVAGLARRASRNPNRIPSAIKRNLSQVDIDFLSRHTCWFNSSFLEATRDPSGFVYELGLFSGDWRCLLRDIRVPVRIVHGALDRSSPSRVADYLFRTISQSSARCELKTYERQGHFSTLRAAAEQVLSWPS